MTRTRFYIGCAGWSIPSTYRDAFPEAGSHLERYGGRFRAVEINSSFYRPHRPATYARWASTVPEHFRFAVKMPKQITHTQRLRDAELQVERFLGEVSALGAKLGPILVQLPPSLAFDELVADTFFGMLRERFEGFAVCEPRHESWFATPADDLLSTHQIARVAADPAIVPRASIPGGWQGIVYYRLHGSPQTYYSSYDARYVERLARALVTESPDVPVWCIFDNTAEGAATENALRLQQLLISDQGEIIRE